MLRCLLLLPSLGLLVGCGGAGKPHTPIDEPDPIPPMSPNAGSNGPSAIAVAPRPTTRLGAAAEVPFHKEPTAASYSADATSLPLSAPSEQLQAWTQKRLAAAASGGLEEIVELPLVRRGDGWGCVCPPHYIGINGMMQQGPWIQPTFEGVRPPAKNQAVLAVGVFGKKMVHVSYPAGPPPSEKIEYELLPFEVRFITPLPKDIDEENAQLRIVERPAGRSTATK